MKTSYILGLKISLSNFITVSDHNEINLELFNKNFHFKSYIF